MAVNCLLLEFKFFVGAATFPDSGYKSVMLFEEIKAIKSKVATEKHSSFHLKKCYKCKTKDSRSNLYAHDKKLWKKKTR